MRALTWLVLLPQHKASGWNGECKWARRAGRRRLARCARGLRPLRASIDAIPCSPLSIFHLLAAWQRQFLRAHGRVAPYIASRRVPGPAQNWTYDPVLGHFSKDRGSVKRSCTAPRPRRRCAGAASTPVAECGGPRSDRCAPLFRRRQSVAGQVQGFNSPPVPAL